MPQHQALIALGANLGDAQASLGLALELLQKLPVTSVSQSSSLYTSNPVGGPMGQPRFFNAVAELVTDLAPMDLLLALQQVEADLGRVRAETWSARSLDLDILSYDRLILVDPHLVLPHPRMTVRRFVMEPLAEILPQWQHPQLHWSAARLASHLATAPRAVRFPKALDEVRNFPATLEFYNRFSELAPGWEVTRHRADAMFEVFFSKDLTLDSPWRLPRFYPTADDPETLVNQVIATCRGLTDSVFAV